VILLGGDGLRPVRRAVLGRTLAEARAYRGLWAERTPGLDAAVLLSTCQHIRTTGGLIVNVVFVAPGADAQPYYYRRVLSVLRRAVARTRSEDVLWLLPADPGGSVVEVPFQVEMDRVAAAERAQRGGA
jgi:hypothetical protein